MKIDLFRSGAHTAMGGKRIEFSDTDLQACASTYDPAKHEAPIVVGHPTHDAPAYGWVTGLSYADGKLTAETGDVDAAFGELVSAGRFKKVSASFYTPDCPSNPSPGSYSLRHVGFLGAQPPAIKGLKAVEFADGEEGLVTLEFADAETANAFSTVAGMLRGLRDWMLGKYGQEEADKALPGWNADWLTQQAARMDAEANPSPAYSEGGIQVAATAAAPAGAMESDAAAAVLSAREQDLASRQAELDTRAAAFAEAQKAARETEDGAELDRLVSAGVLPPGWRAPVAAFLEQLDAEGTVSFSEGQDAETPRAFMLRLLKSGKKVIDFGEAAPAGAPAPDAQSASTNPSKIRARVDQAKADGRTISFAEAQHELKKEETAQ